MEINIMKILTKSTTLEAIQYDGSVSVGSASNSNDVFYMIFFLSFYDILKLKGIHQIDKRKY